MEIHYITSDLHQTLKTDVHRRYTQPAPKNSKKLIIVYIHNVNPKMRLKDMAMRIYKMAAGYNRKWRCLIRRPPKPHPRNKHEVDRTTRR